MGQAPRNTAGAEGQQIDAALAHGPAATLFVLLNFEVDAGVAAQLVAELQAQGDRAKGGQAGVERLVVQARGDARAKGTDAAVGFDIKPRRALAVVAHDGADFPLLAQGLNVFQVQSVGADLPAVLKVAVGRAHGGAGVL